jgi:hypothetical protein
MRTGIYIVEEDIRAMMLWPIWGQGREQLNPTPPSF